jgi:TctA family transporter
MKTWTIAALLTGFFVVPLFVHKLKGPPKNEQSRSDQRYSIDDLIADQPID